MTRLTFYHLSVDAATYHPRSTDAATHSNSLRATLEDRYPGTFTDTARVGPYTFDISQTTEDWKYCGMTPRVTKNGVVIDEGDQLRDYSSYYDDADDTNNLCE